jgi:hypothetical protein
VFEWTWYLSLSKAATDALAAYADVVSVQPAQKGTRWLEKARLVAGGQHHCRGSLPAAVEPRAQGDAPRSVVVLCRHPDGAPLSTSVGHHR